MQVLKRDGSSEPMEFDKIQLRLSKLAQLAPPLQLDMPRLVIGIASKLYDGIDTVKIDELTAQECAVQVTQHPDFGVLAGRIVVSNNHKNTAPSLLEAAERLHAYLAPEYLEAVRRDGAALEAIIDYDRDYAFDYFGFKTLERAYLLRLDGAVVERPQHMWMRVAVALHGADLARVRETYDLLSLKQMTHATPTLFNAGLLRPQLSSCFLVALQEDSIDGIYDTLKDCANISKWAGGIGLHMHNLRAKGSHIRGTNGTSNGLVPMLRVFNESARFVDQGGGKRNGSIAIYLSPDHADIEAWLDLKKNTGDEHSRCRDLFYGLWVPDLFMRRVETDAPWSLFCPNKCPGLSDAHGADYDALYAQYEREGRAERTVSARALWFKVLDAQMETGTPSILYKDACNAKSNQQNLGTIKSSNLCTEIVEYSDAEETAVCNLASLSLPAFVRDGAVDYDALHAATMVVTRNLNRIIDLNYYPTEKARRSNLRHRPLGIGVQGLADLFFLLDLSFESAGAREVNRHVFETMYHAAMAASVELAKAEGAYETFAGSPLARGQFQFDLWGVAASDRYDWEELRRQVREHGARNSLLIAPMPTASTSQILGNNECFEPITSNLYTRRTNAGEFIVLNHYLVRDLLAMGRWDTDIKNSIITHQGSVQHLDLPPAMKAKYKTVWEIPMRAVIDLAAERAPFICQSQSLNLFVADPNYQILTSMHFYAWKKGLKTGLYYLRRKPRYQPQQFTVPPPAEQQPVCTMCSA
jgi:ribonucleoside-diphosphate reductase alpha subunit